MTLTVETGTGNPAADSYCSVAAADAYHLGLGNTAWAVLTNDAKEVALRRAAAYMLQAYRERWDGYRKTIAQALDWPRTEVQRRDAPVAYGSSRGYMLTYYPDDAVPTIVVNAAAELALRSLTQPLLPDQERKVQSESVGPIAVSYEPGSQQLVRFTAVDAMLAPVLAYSASMATVRRA